MNPKAYEEMAQIEDHHWWFCGRRQIASELISSLALPSNSRILEVGCGTGGNLQMLSKFGQVSAFELNEIACSIAKEKSMGRADVQSGFCPDGVPFENQQFDLICLFDVLEHIQEDSATLRRLKRYLKPHGYILMTVPAYPWLYGPHDLFLHHLRRYTAGQIQELAKGVGLQALKLSYFNTFLFPFALIARLKDRVTQSASATGAGMPGHLVNTILQKIFSLERYWLKYFDFLFGVSLVGIFSARDSKTPGHSMDDH